jgi:nucleotide-binding universal stress UspA family protein/quercetin dioxygenase-like cupin family protein
MHTILHPTDFTAEAEYAFRMATSLARDYQATLILLHVLRPSVAADPDKVPNPLESADAQEVFQGHFPWPVADDPNIRIDHRLAEGDAAEVIVQLAQTLHCDLIIMGTHGRTGLSRLLTGSVAEEVVRHAPCPVMTIRHAVGSLAPVPTLLKPLAKPGEIVDLATAAAPTAKLLHARGLEAVHFHLATGKEVFERGTRGTQIVHCLQGRLRVTALGQTRELTAGQLLYLPGGEPRTFTGIEDAVLLLTTALPAV